MEQINNLSLRQPHGIILQPDLKINFFIRLITFAFISPSPELNSFRGLHPITHGQDHIKIVVIYLISFAITGSCRKFCDN